MSAALDWFIEMRFRYMFVVLTFTCVGQHDDRWNFLCCWSSEWTLHVPQESCPSKRQKLREVLFILHSFCCCRKNTRTRLSPDSCCYLHVSWTFIVWDIIPGEWMCSHLISRCLRGAIGTEAQSFDELFIIQMSAQTIVHSIHMATPLSTCKSAWPKREWFPDANPPTGEQTHDLRGEHPIMISAIWHGCWCSLCLMHMMFRFTRWFVKAMILIGLQWERAQAEARCCDESKSNDRRRWTGCRMFSRKKQFLTLLAR